MAPDAKIKSIAALAAALEPLRAQGKSLVHCHGVFDLVHIGHIKHLQAAKRIGDILLVTLTPDRFVNKGPSRPAFPQHLRAEALAALACVDFVAINEWPTAVETIQMLKPSVFVKGTAPGQGKRDHADGFSLEEQAIKAVGGRLVLTEEETYSASALINRHFDAFSPEARLFLEDFRTRHTPEKVVECLQGIKSLRVLAVGETIIDEYVFCSVMAKANKDPILAARYLYSNKYAGGILAIGNHLAGFCERVGLLSMLGEEEPQEDFIASALNPKIHTHFLRKPGSPTIVKRRFLEEYMAVKLFEVYVMRHERLAPQEDAAFCARLEQLLPEYDVVVVADYGHGLLTERAVQLVCEKSKFLAVNAQTNAGNKGFNFISKYPRADYVSIDEPEARLEARNFLGDPRELIDAIRRKMDCGKFLITRGKKGCICYDVASGFVEIPAFAVKLVDRMGAGDAVLALTAPCVAQGVPMPMVGFIGNMVGAEACSIMGNERAIDPSSLYRHITSIVK